MTSLVGNAASPVKDGTSSLPRRQSSFARPPLRALYDLLVAPMEGVSARPAIGIRMHHFLLSNPCPYLCPPPQTQNRLLRQWGFSRHGASVSLQTPTLFSGGRWAADGVLGTKGADIGSGPSQSPCWQSGRPWQSRVHVRRCSFPACFSHLRRSRGPGLHAFPHLLHSQGGRCAHVSSPAHRSSEGLT